jgi:hypothetical protein
LVRSNHFIAVSFSRIKQLALFGIKVVDKVRAGTRQECASVLADRVGWNVLKEPHNTALIKASLGVVKLEIRKTGF